MAVIGVEMKRWRLTDVRGEVRCRGNTSIGESPVEVPRCEWDFLSESRGKMGSRRRLGGGLTL